MAAALLPGLLLLALSLGFPLASADKKTLPLGLPSAMFLKPSQSSTGVTFKVLFEKEIKEAFFSLDKQWYKVELFRNGDQDLVLRLPPHSDEAFTCCPGQGLRNYHAVYEGHVQWSEKCPDDMPEGRLFGCPGMESNAANPQSTQQRDAPAPSTQHPDSKAPSPENPDRKSPSAENLDQKAPSTKNLDPTAPSTDTPDSKVSSTHPSTGRLATTAPSTQNPDAKAPSTQNPGAKAPPTQNPDAKAPPTQNPDAKAPPTQNPDAKAPPTQNPDAKAPPTQNPDAKAPPTQNPGAKAPSEASSQESSSSTEAPVGVIALLPALAVTGMLLLL